MRETPRSVQRPLGVPMDLGGRGTAGRDVIDSRRGPGTHLQHRPSKPLSLE